MRLISRFSIAAVILVVCLLLTYHFAKSWWVPVYQTALGQRTVAKVVETLGVPARERLIPQFRQAGVSYPPNRVTLLASKRNKTLEVWVGSESSPIHIHTYSIEALSGDAGPKLREGDRQVPEGIYAIDGLNPNSRFHLSMKLDYPNQFDLRHAKADGRTQLGGDIFIHGKAVSTGCLAMGDAAIEELFVLAADVGREHFKVVIAPHDPRQQALVNTTQQTWVNELYATIRAEFVKYQQH